MSTEREPRKPLVIGLAGGIASGKSLVARELAKLPGVVAIDVDRLAWEVYRPGTPAYRELVEHFGPEIVGPDGKIDRKRLGERVFSDPEELRFLDEVVHPALTERLRELIAEHRRRGTEVLLVEAALLLEAPHVDRGLFDWIIALKVDREEQLRRLCERDGLSREEALRRIGAQDPGKLEEADFVLDTTGSSPEETVAKVRELILKLIRRSTSPSGGE